MHIGNKGKTRFSIVSIDTSKDNTRVQGYGDSHHIYAA
jgi:hypothetical protein